MSAVVVSSSPRAQSFGAFEHVCAFRASPSTPARATVLAQIHGAFLALLARANEDEEEKKSVKASKELDKGQCFNGSKLRAIIHVIAVGQLGVSATNP